MGLYSEVDRKYLLEVARKSIEHGVLHASPLPVKIMDYSKPLQEKRASFVTLHLNNELRGCIGTLQAYQPLIQDVALHAFAAAFEDPRFPKVTKNEIPHLKIHISVLSPSEPISFTSEEDLIKKIRPGIDGLILSDRGYRGTFLPSVWEELRDPRQFLRHLKRKAGLSEDYWSDTITVERYTTESIG